MLCFHAAQTGNYLLRTQNVSEQNQEHFFVSRTQNLCPQQILHARQTGKHLCRQQCVRNNVFSFARALILHCLFIFFYYVVNLLDKRYVYHSCLQLMFFFFEMIVFLAVGVFDSVPTTVAILCFLCIQYSNC